MIFYKKKIGIKQSDSCTFCGEATENLVHLFWSCKYSNAFWKDCYQWIMQNTSKVDKFNLSGALLFGLINDAKNLLLQFYCTIYYLLPSIISTPVNKEIRAQMYIQTVQRTVEIERQIAKDHNSLDTFEKKWSFLLLLLLLSLLLFTGIFPKPPKMLAHCET